MKNIETLIQEYEKNSDLIARVEDYTHSENLYLCDIIAEIAESETDIYYSNLIDWLKNNHDAIESVEFAIDEFGTPKNDRGNTDFIKIIQQGQYYQNEQVLYDNLQEIGKVWLLAYLRDKENLQEITDEQAEFIDDLDIDNNNQFSDLLDKWNEYNKNND